MKTGVKIAVGCVAAVVLAGAAGVAAVMGFGFWAKGKVEQFAGGEKKIEELHKRADANPFVRPVDGVLSEDRLVKFLGVRRQVFAVYEKHQAEIEAISKKKQGDLGDVATGLKVLNELRLAQAQGLADEGMSQEEYRYLVEQIYKTLFAAEVARRNQGKSVSQVTGEAYDQAAEAMKKAAEGGPAAGAGDEDLTPEQRKVAAEEREKAQAQARQSAEQMAQAAREAKEKAKELDVPPQNLALFQKHEAEIKKYAMNGLELIGL